MKKLFTLLSLLALIGLSANVWAQSTGTTPAPGATHSYSVTDNSNTFTWSVTEGDLTTNAGSDATLSATTGNSINITWASTVTVGDWYYVHVVEEDANGCSNEKVLPVQITASPFNLVIAAAEATQCYDGDVVVSLLGNDPQYDHGNATIVYTVTPSGLSGNYAGYTFDLSIAVPADYNATPAFSANASIAGNTVTVTDNAAVTITYTVDNTNVYTNANDAAGSAADFTATATISDGETSNGVSDNGSGTYSDATAVSRPHTTVIATN